MEGKYVMQERERLEAELAEARKQLAAIERANDQLQVDLAKAYRDLAAVEKERDAYKRAKSENDERFCNERDDARQERDEALARAERAEADADFMHKAIDAMEKDRAYFEQERDEALALAETLRGALQSIREDFEDLQGGCNHCGSYEGHIDGCFLFYACEVLNLTPPQALAQQRERMEALENLMRIAERVQENTGDLALLLGLKRIYALAEFDANGAK